MKFDEWYQSFHSTVDRRTAEVIWETCKQECIKSLQRPIQNCDLSWEKVNERFINRIEKDV